MIWKSLTPYTGVQIWKSLTPYTGVQIGRVNLGRDRGLATRLMGSKDKPPSVAAWSGARELKRVRWDFQDTSIEGMVKWAAQVVRLCS